GAEGTDAFADRELAAGIRRDVLVEPAQALEIGRVGHQDPRHDARLRGVADRVLADREGLEQRRVRVLVGPRHDADLAHHALRVDLARRAIGPRPFGDWPAPDALLVGGRHLVVFAVVVPDLFGPSLLDGRQVFLVGPAGMG